MTGEEYPEDVLASLILAARQDTAFRNQVLMLLRLPLPQRKQLIRSAVADMEASGEPPGIRAAFLALGTVEGGRVAARLIEDK